MAKINKDEYEILKSLDDKWKWIARDERGELYIYEEKPKKIAVEWVSERYYYLYLGNETFQFIQWEDEEPYHIPELIDEYEREYHIENAKIVNIDASKIAGNASDYKHFYKRVGESEETEMKKDKKWLLERVDNYIPPHDKTVGQVVANILDIIRQLDEPETLSQEVPKIPKFVAEWLEKYIEYGYDLYPALKKMENNSRSWKKTYDWYRKNTHTFVNAYLTGKYEVEEEQKYYVLDKEDNILLIRGYRGIEKADNLKITNSGGGALKLTEQEIKDYDERYIPFMVTVDEVNNDCIWSFRKPVEELEE